VVRRKAEQMTTSQILSQIEIKRRLDNDQIIVSDWDALHKRFSRMTDTHWIFRGVSAPTHYPLPSIGREKIFGPYKRTQEERLFREFKDRAQFLLSDSRLTDWDWLAFAQHVGVPTRLLDWTTSPLIAAFFALEEDNDQDRLIYCVKYSRFIHEVENQNVSPFDNRKEGRYTPPLLFDRLRAQRGIFTIHPDPTKIFYQSSMRVIRLPNSCVKYFRRRLFKYGIDYWHIYPDTHGLGLQLKWQFRNKVGLGSFVKKIE
jgi:hypothetical protein